MHRWKQNTSIVMSDPFCLSNLAHVITTSIPVASVIAKACCQKCPTLLHMHSSYLVMDYLGAHCISPLSFHIDHKAAAFSPVSRGELTMAGILCPKFCKSILPSSNPKSFNSWVSWQLPFGCDNSRERLLQTAPKNHRRRLRNTGSNCESSCC